MGMARRDDLVVITAEKVKGTFETVVAFRDKLRTSRGI